MVKKSKPVRYHKSLTKKTKRSSKAIQIDRMDKKFSEIVRRTEAKNFSGGEVGKCVTCGYTAHWKHMDCGHFITRDHKSTRWELKNCSLQCKGCNGPQGGRQHEHGLALDAKWGPGTADKMLIKSKNFFHTNMSNLGLIEADLDRQLREL